MGSICLRIKKISKNQKLEIEKICKKKNLNKNKIKDEENNYEISSEITAKINLSLSDLSIIKNYQNGKAEKKNSKQYEGIDKYFTKQQYLDFTTIYGKDIGKTFKLEKEVKSKELDYIARGSFGIVIKSYDENNKIFIVTKKVKIKNKSKEEIKKIKREIKILKNFRHRNIISCFGYTQTKSFLNIYFEFAGLKSLDIMLKEYTRFSPSIIKNYTKQILHGLGYLHYQGIIHRDIKGANILVTCKGVVKLSDFGCSKDLGSNLKSFVGSFGWMSPEMFRGERYGRQTDIWSLGCTVYEMYTGRSPFFKERKKILDFDGDIAFPDFIDEEGVSFIKSCIKKNSEDRLNVYELLQHSFVRHVDVYNSACFETGVQLKTYKSSNKSNLEQSDNNLSFRKVKENIFENITVSVIKENRKVNKIDFITTPTKILN